nr:hypothetical protein 1634Bnrm3_p063 [Cryptomonas sp.]
MNENLYIKYISSLKMLYRSKVFWYKRSVIKIVRDFYYFQIILLIKKKKSLFKKKMILKSINLNIFIKKKKSHQYFNKYQYKRIIFSPETNFIYKKKNIYESIECIVYFKIENYVMFEFLRSIIFILINIKSCCEYLCSKLVFFYLIYLNVTKNDS